MDNKLGQKIKKYRSQKGISQFDLELQIETSPGRISKIENGKINPDKETIIKISNALKLDTKEIASLFGLNLPDIKPIFEILNEILLLKKEQQIIDHVVNELIFKLGFIASALFLVENEKIYMRGLTVSSISKKALTHLNCPLDSYSMTLNDKNNLVVRSINKNKWQLTDYTREYCSPLIDIITADEIQKSTGDKSAIIFPLVIESNKIGAIAFVKKVISDFHDEKEILGIVSKQIAIAFHNTSNTD